MDEISYKLADMMNKRKSEESMENRAGLKKEMGLEDREKEIEDLKKAIFYINDRIAQIEGKYDKDKNGR